MSEPALDMQGLLRALVEQQTALLGAHAESMRLQRVLVERLLASDQTLTVAVEAAPRLPHQTPHVGIERMARQLQQSRRLCAMNPAAGVESSRSDGGHRC